MNNITPRQKELCTLLLQIIIDRGAPCGYRYENGCPLLRMEPSADSLYWPTQVTYYPPFCYSLDALQVIERLLSPGELKEYADFLRRFACGESTGIMETHALAQIAPAMIRFEGLCAVLYNERF